MMEILQHSQQGKHAQEQLMYLLPAKKGGKYLFLTMNKCYGKKKFPVVAIKWA